MIIGLNGRLKSGKDTTYQIIKEASPVLVKQVSFARVLKLSAAASIGLSVAQLENWKGDESVHFTRPDGTTFTAREYLQWYGTEGHRDIFGDNFWVDMALPKPHSPEGDWHPSMAYNDAIYVVTDMRFPNEVERVVELGGHTVKVIREAETKFSNHPSEQNIDHMIEYFLDNTGTLDDLRINVEQMLNKFMTAEPSPPTLSLFPAYASVNDAEDMRGWNHDTVG